MPLPMVKPIIINMTSDIIGEATPIAASAWVDTNFPTIILSTTL